MGARLNNHWEKVRTSFWFVPSLLAIAGIALAFAAVAIDRVLPAPEGSFWRGLVGQDPENMAQLLSTIAGSMMTVTGVVFSITIVTLSLASGQFGPRLLRNFMRDRGNQLVLGTFIGTFLYAMVALLQLGQATESSDVPRALVSMAIVLTATSIAVLIFFIHHVAVSIQADTVVASVGKELLYRLQNLYPEQAGRDGWDAGVAVELPEWDKEGATISTKKGGYLQSVDLPGLLDKAVANDRVLRVLFRPGEYLIDGEPLVEVWPPEGVDDDMAKALRRHFTIGPRRTPDQDPEFAVDQLVEVAVRALSPGINDPFTAIACLDHLASGLAHVGSRRMPSPYRFVQGRLRVVAKRSSYAAIAASALDQIRQHGVEMPPVAMRLLETIGRAGRQTTDAERRQILREHADRVMRDVRLSDYDAADLLDVEKAYVDAVAALDGGAHGHDGPRPARHEVYADLTGSGV